MVSEKAKKMHAQAVGNRGRGKKILSTGTPEERRKKIAVDIKDFLARGKKIEVLKKTKRVAPRSNPVNRTETI